MQIKYKDCEFKHSLCTSPQIDSTKTIVVEEKYRDQR